MNQRKVLFWTTFSDWAPVASIERELLLLEKRKGSLCIGIHCDGALQRCHAMRGNQANRTMCIGCQASYLQNVAPMLDRVYHLKSQKPCIKRANYHSHEDLRQIKYNDIDIGRAVLSTIKVDYGDNDVCLDQIQKGIKERLESAILVATQLEELLESIKPDAVYMFNGRHFDSRPLLRLCQLKEIEYYTYETALSNSHYMKHKCSTPHSVSSFQKSFFNYLLEASTEANLELLIKRTNNQEDIYGLNFREGQQSALLPKNFDKSKTNIVILHSSEDEYADVDDSLTIWGASSFNDYLSQLKKVYQNEHGITIYVRIHPRLKRFDSASVKKLLSLGSQNLVIIPPDSSVDTFALACAADVNLCYGSTAGPEAVLLGAKVVCIGECGYSNAGLMPNAYSIDVLKRIIESPSTIMCNQQLAAKYITFLKTRGWPFLLSDAMVTMNHALFVRIISRFKHSLLTIKIPVNRLGVNTILYRCWRFYSMLGNQRISER